MMIHLDLDSFFISAERLIKPGLRNRPAAVGGRGDPFIFNQKTQSKIDILNHNYGAFVPSIFYDAKSNFENYFVEGEKIRGIIITASYEARAYGIKTGMSIKEALDIYPDLIVVAPNHLYYHELSHKLLLFLQKHIPQIEQFSIDEFFGDLNGWVDKKELPSFLHNLQQKIDQEFGLPISIGAAKSKWIAKLATSCAKPHGIKIIEDIDSFINDIPIEEFPGIGRGYLKRLQAYNVKTLGETKHLKNLFYSWKKPGIQLYKRIWGIDNEPIQKESPKKSIGISRTIDPVTDRSEIKRRLIILSRYLAHSITKLSLHPTRFSLKCTYESAPSVKGSLRIMRPFSEKLLQESVLKLFDQIDLYPYSPIIRLGIRCSEFYRPKCFDLFNYEKDVKKRKLFQAQERLREKYGLDTLYWAKESMV